MTEELKPKAKDFIDRINKESDGMWLNKYYLSDLLVMFAEETTKELQEELKKWKDEWQEQVQKATDEGYARTQLQIENGNLKKQIEKMKCCNNCKYRCYMDWKSKCCFDMTEIRDIENPITCKCNKWEIEG